VSGGAKFKIDGGAYAGVYEIDPDEFTGSEVNRFRHAVGVSITEATAGGNIDLDALCGLVWIIKTRSTAAKSLPFQAIADNVTRGMIQPVGDEEPDPADPTSSAAT
jgi:hypothetical protein